MEELLEKLLIDFRNPLYPNGGVLTTEAQVRAALIVAFDAGRVYGRSDTIVRQDDCELFASVHTAIAGPPALLNECAYCGEACEGNYCSEEHEEKRSMY